MEDDIENLLEEYAIEEVDFDSDYLDNAILVSRDEWPTWMENYNE